MSAQGAPHDDGRKSPRGRDRRADGAGGGTDTSPRGERKGAAGGLLGLDRLLPEIALRCDVPEDLESVESRGEEAEPHRVRASRADVEAIWEGVRDLYRSGAHPAIQLCVRRHGEVVLDRAIGHARGNAPGEREYGVPRVPIRTTTPVNLFSAAKPVTAMLMHKLEEEGLLHLDDAVAEYIPGFARHGKQDITIRHVLTHRAGIAELPAGAMDLDLLSQPDRVLELICDTRPTHLPGHVAAYHAVTGGFVMAEVARAATGRSLRDLLREEVKEPLGLGWFDYGVPPDQVDLVAQNAFTGVRLPWPFSLAFQRILGADIEHVVDLSNDPRFLSGLIPSANVITTARDAATFYQCLLDEGELGGVRIFEARSVRRAVRPQGWVRGPEFDRMLGLPLRYGTGFMLGNSGLSLYGFPRQR